jgi:hypothetical protein
MDFAAEQAGIERRRRIAEMLMQQGAEPMETNQVAGGYVIPVSPLSAVAKVAQQLAGAYMGKKAEDRAVKLDQERAAALGSIDFNAPDAASKLAGVDPKLAIALAMKRASNHSADPYYTPVETSQGLFKFNARTGDYEPMMEGDKRLMRSTSDPMQQAQITAAKEGQKGVEVLDAEGRKLRARQADTNPSFYDALAPLGVKPPVTTRGPEGGSVTDLGSGAVFEGDISTLSPEDARTILNDLSGRGKKAEIIKGPSAAEESALSIKEAAAKELNKTQIENAAKLQQEQNKRQAQGSRMLEMLTNPIDGEPIEELIKTATGSGLGAIRDAASRIVGVSSPQSQAAAKLESLGGWLTSNVPRMEGPQSDRDTQMYKQMAGNLADRNVPAEEKMAAYRTILDIARRQAAAGNPHFSGFMQSAPTDDSIDDLVNQYLR